MGLFTNIYSYFPYLVASIEHYYYVFPEYYNELSEDMTKNVIMIYNIFLERNGNTSIGIIERMVSISIRVIFR